MDTERFLATAGELLAVQSTADRPGELHRALGFVLHDDSVRGHLMTAGHSPSKPNRFDAPCSGPRGALHLNGRRTGRAVRLD